MLDPWRGNAGYPDRYWCSDARVAHHHIPFQSRFVGWDCWHSTTTVGKTSPRPGANQFGKLAASLADVAAADWWCLLWVVSQWPRVIESIETNKLKSQIYLLWLFALTSLWKWWLFIDMIINSSWSRSLPKRAGTVRSRNPQHVIALGSVPVTRPGSGVFENTTRLTRGRFLVEIPPELHKMGLNHLPSGNGWHSYWKWPFIVSFPIENGDFP